MAESGVTRKLAAVLYADVAGYSRLTGEDEEGTHRLLGAYLDAIAKGIEAHKGTVVHYAGDAVLAEFASVVAALSCAVTIQRDLKTRNETLPNERKLQFRIGINLGDVIVDRNDIYGDGVNIAARLESLADPGGICVSQQAFDQVENKLALGYEDLGEQEVKNIKKPVHAYRVLMEPEAAGRVIGGEIRRRHGTWKWAALVAGAGVVAAGVSAVLWLRPGLPPSEAVSEQHRVVPLPDKPSIAVLPFDNLGGDPDRLGLGEGLAENIISSLSKVPKLFVVSRNSTFTYKGKPVKVDQVSRELGVRYVLEGSLQKSGAKVRITAQLVDAISGYHLWSETYDRDLDNIFALQDEITLNVITALQIVLTQGELARVRQRGTTNLRAWLLVNQSFEHLMRFTREGNAQARKLAEEALALDPGYTEAYVRLARTHLSDFQIGGGSNPATSLERSIELTQQALALDDSYPDTYILLSAIYLFLKRHDDAELAISKALDLSPNHPLAKAHLGMILTYGGRPEAAINVFKEAMRLSPIYPDWFLSELARAYFLTGRYSEAIEALQRRLQHDPNSGEALILLAASESAAGRLDKARSALAKYLEPRPSYTLSHYARGEFYKSPDDLIPVLDALRKAGLPE